MSQEKDVLEVVPIEDINQFATILQRWHKNKVATLEHMLSIPEGTEVSHNAGPPEVLTGDLLRGFVLGINLSLMELGTLPFAFGQDDVESLTPATEATDVTIQ